MPSLRHRAQTVAKRLLDAGFTTYFAGGCVRDQLLGNKPKDYDIATSATPTEVLQLFPNGNSVGAHFGVILVKEEGYHFEIATFRTDGSYSDGRKPESVTFSTPEEDAQRRDFTINGLFQNPLTGEVIDFVNGQSDLQTRTLRAIGEPKLRFQEDSLRLLRAVRFATKLNFEIHPDTGDAIKGNAAGLQRISPERIRDEFSQIITHSRRAFGIRKLVELNLIDHFLPEVRTLIGCEQPPQWHPEGDVFEHTMIALDLLGETDDLTLCLATLLHDIAKPPTQTFDEADNRIRFNGHDALGAEMTGEILRRLKYPNKIQEDASFIVSRHMQFMNVTKMRMAKVRRFMASPVFEKEMELHRVDCASSNGFTENYDFLRKKEEEFAAEPLIPKPLVTGKDLIDLGLSPGPTFKELLQEVQTLQLEGSVATRAEALEVIKGKLSS